MSIRQGSTIIAGSSGSGGTSNYNNLENKPSINGITLEGNKTTEDLNINSLPDQTGNEGKVLITNGTEASWQTLPETGLPLFAHIWSDHLLTNTSYLRADTFSWQDGNIYYTAYNELVNEKNLTTEASTDTINDIIITYYRTPKGYKIVLPDMADTIAQLYENTGTAWYYILDTNNTRFKLPRNSRYESGTTTEKAGDFGAENLPNITGTFNIKTNSNSAFAIGQTSGAFSKTSDSSQTCGNLETANLSGNYIASFNASRSSSTYQDGAKVNPDHVTQFLYFYVGNTVQNETTINVAAITEVLNKKADRDLNNLTEDATNAVKPSDITNCITKIPQDIKLELNNGILTLKAGSKVYIPNGKNADDSLKFDEVTIQSDVNGGQAGTNNNVFYLLNPTRTGMSSCAENNMYSGATEPTGTTYAVWYDTTNNRIGLRNTGASTFTFGYSFPITTANISSNLVTSINQIFNGFGYIGSTIFALPGIEGLIPNGRNPDGSLNSAKVTTDSVSILTGASTGNYILTIRDAGYVDNWSIARYNEDKNIVYRIDNNQQVMLCFCGHLSRESGRVTSFSPKSVFRAVDRNDTEWVSTQSKPSDRYVDLTLQANGTSYTAPANGTVYFAKQAGANTPVYLWIENTNSSFSNISWINSDGSSDFTSVSLPVAAGDVFKVYYTAKGNTNYFRFIYDKGSK